MSKKKTVHVSVTERDIRKGVRHNGSACPNYFAIRRALRYRVPVYVGAFYVARGDWSIAELPRWVQRWILHFDEGVQVEPIEYDLEVEL